MLQDMHIFVATSETLIVILASFNSEPEPGLAQEKIKKKCVHFFNLTAQENTRCGCPALGRG